MTDKKPSEESSAPGQPAADRADAAGGAVQDGGASRERHPAGKTGPTRRPPVKIERFSLRQGELTVPKPSYLKHGGPAALEPGDFKPDDDYWMTDPESASDKNTAEDDRGEARPASAPLFSRSARRWIFVVLSLVFYLVYRMHVMTR